MVEKSIVSQQFGFWTVLEQRKERKKTGKFKYLALCQCSCGTVREIERSGLTRGRSTSCGCRKDQYEKIRGQNSVRYTGFQEICGNLWGSMRYHAKARNHEFSISIEDAWRIFERQNGICALSGLPIRFRTSCKDKAMETASLDRIDSTKGYVKSNIQWVHKNINIMKSIFDEEYFKMMCFLVIRNSPDIKTLFSDEGNPPWLAKMEELGSRRVFGAHRSKQAPQRRG